MSRRTAIIRQADLQRAFKAATAAGVEVRIELDPATGKIVIQTIPADSDTRPGNSWDKVLST